MFTFVLIVCVVGFGLAQFGKLVKNNASASIEAANWIRRMFGR